MKIQDRLVARFETMLAFMDEVHPSKDPVARKQWAAIRKVHEMDCLKYGKCEVCGTEDLLGEYGLTWICDNPKCYQKAAKDTEECAAEFRAEQAKQAKKGGTHGNRNTNRVVNTSVGSDAGCRIRPGACRG